MNNLQLIILIALSPLAQGLIKKVKALSQGRVGTPVLQPYYDLARLFGKDMVISKTTSWIFHATPYIVFASTVAACSLTPVVSADGPIFSVGGIIAIIYTLALAKFFMALAGLDAGTAFGGEGSSREMTVTILVEPMMMLAVFTSAIAAGSTMMAGIAASPSAFFSPAHVLAFAAFYVAIIAETGRVPVDNPDTHLELTMIHEGMVLEYSGRYLALMEWAHYIKQLLLFTLAIDLFFPYGMAGREHEWGIFAAFGFYAVKVFVLSVAVALTESSRAKLRFFQLPSLLGGSFVLSALSVVTLVMMGR